jgi:hypoxanthine phosphoribosyltransferase
MTNEYNILISEEQINTRLKEMGKVISSFYEGKKLTVVAVTNGAMIFAADILRQIKVPLQVDTLSVDSYASNKSTGKLTFRSKPKLCYEGRHVLIIDDILDTGLTLQGISKIIKKEAPASIKICVLLDKQLKKRQAEIVPDWTGFKVPDEYVYGYGLDRDEFDRNLPFIATMCCD